MPRCIRCALDYERDAGPMINVCDECLAAPAAPEAYHAPNGVFVANPAYEAWKLSEYERLKTRNPYLEE